MSRIGTLTGGAGVVSVFSGQAQADQYLLLGDVDTANPLQAFQVEIDGKTVININSAALITAWMKYLMELNAGTVGLLLKVCTGQIKKSTTYRLTNSGATTPDVLVFSESKTAGAPFEVSSKTINANSVESFDKFSVLFLETPANLNYAEITFRDGHVAQLTAVEVDAWFSVNNQTEANGRLGTVSVIDNSRQQVKSVKVYTNGVGALTVLMGKIPDAAFKALSAGMIVRK